MDESGESDVATYVDLAYETRATAWQSARESVEHWLQKVCNELLEGSDRSRLSTGHGRIKDRSRALDKIRQKANDESLTIDSAADVETALTDLVGLKVLCKSTRDQRAVFNALKDPQRLGELRLHKERNYVDEPKNSGYRACHIIFQVPVLNESPVLCEVQIKTRLQDAWGELTHEDLYKPGSAMKPQPFHGSVARAMASLLAEVDKLADDLAVELESAADARDIDDHHSKSRARNGELLTVKVRTSGQRYALAVDEEGQQGLIPARAVRDFVDATGLIKVDDYISVGDRLRVRVQEDARGIYYLPLAQLSASSVTGRSDID